MSLFGSSPTESAPVNSKSLFGEESARPASNASLFAEDGGESPWSMPTPKKSARQNLVKNLLPATDVPDSYVDAYDAVLNANERTGVGIGMAGIKRVLESSTLSEQEQNKILNLVIPGGQESANGVGRSEFNVLLALIGLGQEGEEITLDGVDERRRSMDAHTCTAYVLINISLRIAPASHQLSRPAAIECSAAAAAAIATAVETYTGKTEGSTRLVWW